jgi:hypothetical protein
MEVLKSGDVPALVTNIEVMNILTKRIEQRQEQEQQNETQEAARNKKGNKLRHRDFIEEKVYEYLQSTPCAIVDFEKMPEFVGRLKGTHTKEEDATSLTKVDAEIKEGGKEIENETSDKKQGYNLMNAEILQISNHMPVHLVEIHLMIEELMGRMDEVKQNELLQLIAEYAGVPGEQMEEEEIFEEAL